MERASIRDGVIEKDSNGNFKRVKVFFGPHFFVDIMPSELTGELTAYIGYSHHGFAARAVEVNDQLEKIINEVRETHPELVFD